MGKTKKIRFLGSWVPSLITCAACTSAPIATTPYRNSFEAPLGPEWKASGSNWHVVDGRLMNRGAHNMPLWLSLALPDDVRISFTAESKSDAVDIKCELFGDGERHASGYIVILGGWKNSKSIIAKLDEHGREMVVRKDPAKRDHVYRWRIERRGGELAFFLDDEPYLTYLDPEPLRGRGHDRFAFSNWASEVYFDDLVIEPL